MTASDLLALVAGAAAIAAVLSPIILGLVEVIKLAVKAFRPDGIPPEFVPAIAVTVGIGLAMGLMGLGAGADYRLIALGGALGGLAASKLFDLGQAGGKS